MITVAQRPGRLGNLVLQYINLIAFAEDHHATIANPSFFDYNHYFVGTHRDFLSRYPSRNLVNFPLPFRIFFYKSLRIFDKLGFLESLPGTAIINLPANEDFFLDSHSFISILNRTQHIFFRGNWRSIYRSKTQAHLDKARQFFKLVPHRARRVQNFIELVKAKSDITIGVHIRQTDFRDYWHGKYYFTTSQYADYMHQIATIFPNKRVSFIVCSDTHQSKSSFLNLEVHFPISEPVEDLFVLASCDYIIGPSVSSYCTIASLLGNKKRYPLEAPLQPPTLDKFQVADINQIAEK